MKVFFNCLWENGLWHQGKWGNMLDLAPQGSSAVTSEMWLGCCTACPSWSARIQTSSPSMKNAQCQPSSQVPLGFLAVGRNLCKCIDSCPSFQTNTTALHHALWLGPIAPESNISHRYAQTSSTNDGGICLNHSLNGASSVTLITCQLNGYSQVCLVLRRKCHGTQPEETRQNLPVWVAKIPIHSNLISETVFPVFALQSALASGCLGPHPMLLLFQATFVALAPNRQQLLLPLGSSSSESEIMPYYFSLWWWHSCCHCTSQCKHFVLSDPGVMTPLQHVGPESSHSTSYQCMQSSS